jgi:cellulose synthase operon protein C
MTRLSIRVRHSLALLVIVTLLQGCDRDQGAAMLASGKALAASGEHKGAILQFKSVLQLNPEAPEPRLLLAQSLLASGDPVAAELELSRLHAARYEPNKVLPLLARALVQADEFKKLVQLHGNVQLDDKTAQAQFQVELSRAWAALGNLPKAQAAVAAALQASPEHAPANLARARLAARQQRWDEAAQVVDQVLQRDPKLADAWALRGDLHKVQGQTDAATKAYTQALSIDKAQLVAHVGLVSMRLSAADLAGAQKAAAALRSVVPVHPTTAFVDAHLAYLAGDDAKARELAQRLVLTVPDHTGILLLAGLIEYRLGAVAQAVAFFGKASALDPTSEAARENLATAELRLGQTDKALDTIKPLIAENSRNARALALAGDAEMRRGAVTAAERYLQRAAKLDPSNTQVQAAVLVSRISGGDSVGGLAQLQSLAERSADTIADRALFATRLKRREFDAALGVLASMEKKAAGNPEKAAISEMRGRVYLAQRAVPQARTAYTRALELDPALFPALAALVSLDMYERRPDAARQRLADAIKANPKDTSALLALASLRERAGAPQAEVRALLADAVSAAPTLPEARIRQIDYSLRRRLVKDARGQAQEAEAAIPGNIVILELLGRTQAQAGDHEQALTTFRRLAAALPNSAGPYLRLADVYFNSKRPEQARNAVSKALDLEPDNPVAQIAMVELLANSVSGSRAQAFQYLAQQKTSRPNSAVPYALESALQIRFSEQEAALKTLRDGLAKIPHPDLAARQFSLLIQMGRTAEAASFGAAWMKQHPNDVAFEYQMSVLDITRGDMKTAERRLQRVVETFPLNTAALNNLAALMVEGGNKRAVEYAQRAVDIQPDNAVLLDTLASALALDGRTAEAFDAQRRAAELAPDDPRVRLGLARLAVRSGDKALARTELQRLQKLGSAFPQQAEVDALLKQL